jgi:chromosome partitioning protein
VIVAIAMTKGGVGKTTTAVSLACEGMARGMRTLLVDGDEQESALTWAQDAADGGNAAPAVVGMRANLHRPDQLPAMAADYDLTVIDCAPRNDHVTRSALMVADVVVMPCGGSRLDVVPLAKTVALFEEARQVRPELVGAVLITRAQSGQVMWRQARGVLEQSGLPVLRTALGLRAAYHEAVTAGLGPTTYAPSSEAADEVRRVFSEILTLGGRSNGPSKARRRVPAKA